MDEKEIKDVQQLASFLMKLKESGVLEHFVMIFTQPDTKIIGALSDAPSQPDMYWFLEEFVKSRGKTPVTELRLGPDGVLGLSNSGEQPN